MTTDELHRLRIENDQLRHDAATVLRHLDSLRARVAELEGALQPFARVSIPDTWPNGVPVSWEEEVGTSGDPYPAVRYLSLMSGERGVAPLAEDYRRAAAVLANTHTGGDVMPDSDLLAELKRLNEMMTPGEWRYEDYGDPDYPNVIAGGSQLTCSLHGGDSCIHSKEDANGIARLRNLLPRIIAALTPGATVVGVHTASESGHDRPPGSRAV